MDSVYTSQQFIALFYGKGDADRQVVRKLESESGAGLQRGGCVNSAPVADKSCLIFQNPVIPSLTCLVHVGKL